MVPTSMPDAPPPSQNDYVHQRRHGEYEEGRFRLLLQIRTYSHGLRNRRGARINVPLRDRICEACDSGEVEDESHHTWKCSETWWPRLQLLASLSEVYPNIVYDLESLPDDDSRTRFTGPYLMADTGEPLHQGLPKLVPTTKHGIQWRR